MSQEAGRPTPTLTRPDAEAMYERLSEAAARRRRIRGAGRRVSVVASAVAIAGVLVWTAAALIGLSGRSTFGGNSEQSPNYRFEVLKVSTYVDPRTGNEDPARANVEYRLYWTTDVYPGVHNCTTDVFDQGGALIGRSTTEVMAGMSGRVGDGWQRVDGTPATATIACDPRRLDVGAPYAYEISNVRVLGPDPEHPVASSNDVFRVLFDEHWQGPNAPGMVTCDVSVVDSSEEIVATRKFGLMDASGGTHENALTFGSEDVTRQVLPEELSSLTAEFDCVPFTGPSG